MRLSDVPSRHKGRVSVVDLLPDDVREQLVEARETGSHSLTQMLWWLHNDPDAGEHGPNVTKDALRQWFDRRGHHHASR